MLKRRILVIDDQKDVRDAISKAITLSVTEDESQALMERMKARLAGGDPMTPHVSHAHSGLKYEVDTASGGREGCDILRAALDEGAPFSLVFVDMRMPGGWDGLKTMSRIFEIDPKVQVVLCTAFSDYSWNEIVEVLGRRDNLLILKKPF
ncbi:MAG: response regulator, partial [Victivallales bacterium]|nr:response regulator [Victivallales bacterium]